MLTLERRHGLQSLKVGCGTRTDRASARSVHPIRILKLKIRTLNSCHTHFSSASYLLRASASRGFYYPNFDLDFEEASLRASELALDWMGWRKLEFSKREDRLRESTNLTVVSTRCSC